MGKPCKTGSGSGPSCKQDLSIKTIGSFHVISTQKNPDPLRFLRKLVTIRYLMSDDATPILGSPHQVFLDLWPFLCGQFFTNFADLKCLNTHNSIILKSQLLLLVPFEALSMLFNMVPRLMMKLKVKVL